MTPMSSTILTHGSAHVWLLRHSVAWTLQHSQDPPTRADSQYKDILRTIFARTSPSTLKLITPLSHDRTSLLGPRSLCFLGYSYIHKSLTTEVFGHSLNRKLKLSMWMSKTVQALCSHQRAHKPHAAIRKHIGPLQPLESAQTPCSHQSIQASIQPSESAEASCRHQSKKALCYTEYTGPVQPSEHIVSMKREVWCQCTLSLGPSHISGPWRAAWTVVLQ